MTELSNDPLMVSLVAASTSLPVFLFVYIAGALADILDRRKYLLTCQVFMLVMAAALTVFTWSGNINLWLLLFFTFAIGTGAAFMMPAWDAIIPELVPGEDLQQAVALGSIGINVARAVGPALAGLIISLMGSYAVFAINTMTFVGVIAALFVWKRDVPKQGMAPERFIGSLRSGLRFIKFNKSLQLVLLRSVVFFTPAIALLSLLPVYVREVLGGDARVLGYLQASMGAGAILMAFLLPGLKKRGSIDILISSATVVIAAAYMLLAYLPGILFGCVALFLAGSAWITAFTLFRVTAQQSVPDWVRARAMAILLMSSFGAMTLGSTIWGQTASSFGLVITYSITAGVALVLAFLSLKFKLAEIASTDNSPADDFSNHGDFIFTPANDTGPVLITIHYPVAEHNVTEFMEHMSKLKQIRQRNGSFNWTLLRDLEKPDEFVEHFMVESWEEHERQHSRTTVSEKAVLDAVFSCLKGNKKPSIKHMIAHQI